MECTISGVPRNDRRFLSGTPLEPAAAQMVQRRSTVPKPG